MYCSPKCGERDPSTRGISHISVSRRTVARGAAWAVPVVAVGAAAPAMAASTEFLTFTGNACKLPGNSDSVYKGYVFELLANNPYTHDVALVIESVKVGGVTETIYKVEASSGCSCTPCTGSAAHQICVPASAANLKVLILTGTSPTGHSSNTSMDIAYTVHDCTTCAELQKGTASSGVRSTPPTRGSQCHITGY
jgi:hypothetical protein